MPDPNEHDRPETDGVESAPEDDSGTGQEQAAINRENDPPA